MKKIESIFVASYPVGVQKHFELVSFENIEYYQGKIIILLCALFE